MSLEYECIGELPDEFADSATDFEKRDGFHNHKPVFIVQNTQVDLA